MRLSQFLLALLFPFFINAQTQLPYEFNKVVEPSPTASAFIKYGDIPVNFFVGSPEITIPIYNILTPSFNLSVKLNYHSNGTKVNEDAPWTGLGWSLITGGIITKTTKHLDDFNTSYGYYYQSKLPDVTKVSYTTQEMEEFRSISENRLDSEPDIFNYNFEGYSGSFVLGKKVDGSKVWQGLQDNLKIVFDNGKWVVTDDRGYIYYFNSTEIARDYSTDKNISTVNGVTGFIHNPHNVYTTSWRLNKIVSPTGEDIVFEYKAVAGLSVTSRSEELYRFTPFGSLSNCGNIFLGESTSINNTSINYTLSRQDMTELYLDKIIFQTGSLEFLKSRREDVEYLPITNTNILPPSKLEGVIVKNKRGDVIKKFRFEYSYFNGANKNGRLKLDKVVEVDKSGKENPPYIFAYQNPALPDKNSKSIDHWGFYNGKANSTIIPSAVIPRILKNDYFEGGDRSPDITNNYPIRGMIKSIDYPTGGRTTFEFELNEYSPNVLQYPVISKSAIAETWPSNIYYKEFTVEAYRDMEGVNHSLIPVKFSASYAKYDPNASADLGFFGYGHVYKKLQGGGMGSTVAAFSKEEGVNSASEHTTVVLDPGTYVITLLGTNGWKFGVTASYSQNSTVPITKIVGGGARISKIVTSEASGKEIVRKFSYSDDSGQTSGKLLIATGEKGDSLSCRHHGNCSGSYRTGHICQPARNKGSQTRWLPNRQYHQSQCLCSPCKSCCWL